MVAMSWAAIWDVVLLILLPMCILALAASLPPPLLKLLRRHLSRGEQVGARALAAAVSRLQAEKACQLRLLCRTFSLALCPKTLLMLQEITKKQLTPRSTTGAQEAVLLASQLLLLAAVHFPRAVAAATLDVWYGMLMLLSCLAVLAEARSPEEWLPFLLFGNSAVFLLAAVRRTRGSSFGPAFLVGCNVAYAASSCGAIMLRLDEDWGSPQLLSQGRLQLAGWQLSSLFMVTLAAFHVEHRLLSLMCACMATAEAAELMEAARSLLSGSCSCWVELDRHGAIVSPAGDLASLLLMGKDQPLLGRRLADLISEECDRRDLLVRLDATAVPETGSVESMRVKTVDGNKHTVNLDLLLFRFPDEGEVCFLVGIREIPDADGMPSDGDGNLGHSARECQAPVCPLCPASLEEEKLGMPDTSSMMSCLEYSCNPATLIVDGASADLPILSFSSGFALRIGRPPLRTQLTELLLQPNLGVFSHWLQESLDDLQCGSEARAQQVTLRMPQGHLQAMCRLLEKTGEQEGKHCHLSLVFSNIWPVNRRDQEQRLRHSQGPLSGVLGRPFDAPAPPLRAFL